MWAFIAQLKLMFHKLGLNMSRIFINKNDIVTMLVTGEMPNGRQHPQQEDDLTNGLSRDQYNGNKLQSTVRGRQKAIYDGQCDQRWGPRLERAAQPADDGQLDTHNGMLLPWKKMNRGSIRDYISSNLLP